MHVIGDYLGRTCTCTHYTYTPWLILGGVITFYKIFCPSQPVRQRSR
jgi:hypothetical protein